MTARDAVRWLVALAAALLVIGLIAYARGPAHHHGDDVGSHGASARVVPA
jgi:hypothetical protein